MAKQEEFDVLTFFIYVMGLLTLIVGGFALLNKSKLKKESLKLRGSVRLPTIERTARCRSGTRAG